jgi:hypothetical protein
MEKYVSSLSSSHSSFQGLLPLPVHSNPLTHTFHPPFLPARHPLLIWLLALLPF